LELPHFIFYFIRPLNNELNWYGLNKQQHFSLSVCDGIFEPYKPHGLPQYGYWYHISLHLHPIYWSAQKDIHIVTPMTAPQLLLLVLILDVPLTSATRLLITAARSDILITTPTHTAILQSPILITDRGPENLANVESMTGVVSTDQTQLAPQTMSLWPGLCQDVNI
jgi:hypothetical protein